MSGGPALVCPGCGGPDVDLRRGLLCGTCAEAAAGGGETAMGDVYLNGRRAAPFELAAIEHGRDCEMARDLELLKGLLAEYPRQAPGGPPVSVLSLPELR